MVYINISIGLGTDMKEIMLFIERRNTFAAFLRSLKKGYVLNSVLARVEVGKYLIHLN